MVTDGHNSDSGYVQMNAFGVRLLFPTPGCGKEHTDLDETTLGDIRVTQCPSAVAFLFLN